MCFRVAALFLLSFAISSECVQIEGAENVRDYLNRRHEETKVEIAKAYMAGGNADSVVTQSYDIKREKLWSESLTSEEARTVSMFNKMFILEGDRVLSVTGVPASNKTGSSLRTVDLVRHERSVRFAKSIVWRSNLYLMICYGEVACNLYTGKNDSDLGYRHTIKHQGRPTDATFFARAGRLYLVVAYSSDPVSVPSILYRWTGTYMDMVDEFWTVGPVAVTAFKYKKKVVIVFGQNLKSQPDVGSQVFEFGDSGVEIIQYLATNGPISVQHYHHNGGTFLLSVNERAASSVYCWDGNEFFRYHTLADIVAPRMVSVVQLNDDTLFFVSYETHVRLYKVNGAEYPRLDLLKLDEGETMTDMGVWIDGKTTLTLLLITFDPSGGLYRIEPWELRINKIDKNAGLSEAREATEECLSKLRSRLTERIQPVENVARRVWPTLLSSAKNTSGGALTGERGLARLVLVSGRVARLDVSTTREKLLTAREIVEADSAGSTTNRKIVDSILEQSRNTVRTDEDNLLTGDVVVRNNATFEHLHTSAIGTDYLNGESAKLESFVISATKNQTFSDSQTLRGKNVTIYELEVEQLCGIPREYWLFDGESKIFTANDAINVTDGSVLVRSDLSLRDVKLRSLEGVHMSDFLNDIFIRGERQVIKGNVIKKLAATLGSNNLIIKKLNGASKGDLITRNSNQRLENGVFVKTMAIRNLRVDKINGNAVADSAMTSKKNHIKGKVIVAVMRISDELAFDDGAKLPKVDPVQVYDKVTIAGEVKATNLTFEAYTRFSLSGTNGSTSGDETGILSGKRSHWTKSTKQIISNPVSLEAGVTVDELTVNYLNSLNVNEDVIMTNTKEISQGTGSLTFKNFVSTGSILKDEKDSAADGVYPEIDGSSNKLYDFTDDAIYFNEEFRIKSFSTRNLTIRSFNGIPVDCIISDRQNDRESVRCAFTDEVQRFDSITVNERLETDFLDVRFVNRASLSLDTLLPRDGNYKIDYLESDELTLGGEVNFITGTADRIEEFINASVSDSIAERFVLAIDGELLINGNLHVASINDESTGTYLYALRSRNVTIDSDHSDGQLVIDSLTVRRNLEFNFLFGTTIETLLDSTFSKSRPQNLSRSTFSFFKVSADHLQTDQINQRLTSDLIHTDSSYVNLSGNVAFTNLTVSLDEDIHTTYLNDHYVPKLDDELSRIPSSLVNDLTVNGDVSWRSGKSSSTGNPAGIGLLEDIMSHGVVQSSGTSQEINGAVRIDSTSESIPGVFAGRVRYGSDYSESKNSTDHRLNGVDLGGIVDRSVLDDPRLEREIHIASETSFREDLTASRMSVSGGIGIDALNELSVRDLKSSIVGMDSLSSSMKKNRTGSQHSGERPLRQDDNNRGVTMIFSADVHVRKLIIRSNGASRPGPEIHGVPISAIVIGSSNYTRARLPGNTFIKHLEVYRNALVNSLDSVDFDDFVNDRVTLSMDHEVTGNIRFHGRVRVSDSASVVAINDIVPSDLVINYSQQDQIITGDKIFDGHIAAYGKTRATRLAGINFTDAYVNSVQNHKSADIIGDIIFQSDVETSATGANSSPTRLRLSSESFVNGMALNDLMKNRASDEDSFIRALKRNESILEERVARAANATANLPDVFFYFELEENLKINVARIDRVKVLRIEELTILDMYGSQLGKYCGLPDDCPCREQYVAEIRPNDCQSRRLESGRRIVYNFHPSDHSFGVSVETSSVSSSKRCTASDSSPESTTISWMKNIAGRSGEIRGSNVGVVKLEMHEYLSDVQVFTQDDLVFIALAIYYDPINQSHQTNSLIYALDLASDAVTLVERIPTSHAVGVRVFKVPNRGAHVLFSCLASSESGKPAESLLYRIARGTVKFELVRSFRSGGNRHAMSVSQSHDEFLLLDDVATNSIDVYIYDTISENFHHHQSIYLDSTAPITGLEAFYAGEFRDSQVYVIVTTEQDQFFVYEYMFLGSFQLIARKRVNGILAMTPFDVSGRRYVFVGTAANSTVLRIVQQGL